MNMNKQVWTSTREASGVERLAEAVTLIKGLLKGK
jgi:hypothetical protein